MNQLHGRPQVVHGAYEPSARDIRRACSRIQATWSRRERDKRAGRSSRGSWEPPHVRLSVPADEFEGDEGEWFMPSGTM
jgi:hypothetical protein